MRGMSDRRARTDDTPGRAKATTNEHQTSHQTQHVTGSDVTPLYSRGHTPSVRSYARCCPTDAGLSRGIGRHIAAAPKGPQR